MGLCYITNILKRTLLYETIRRKACNTDIIRQTNMTATWETVVREAAAIMAQKFKEPPPV